MWGYFGIYETVTKSVPLKYTVSYCAEVWEKLLDSTEGMWYMYDTFDKVSFEKSQSFPGVPLSVGSGGFEFLSHIVIRNTVKEEK